MGTQRKSIDEVTEEYNKLHNVPVDVTDSITHEEFVTGVRNKTVGFKVLRGEPITLVRGARKTMFNCLVVLYLVAPLIIVPLWAYHERDWWLLAGVGIASLISPQLAQRKGHSIGALFLLACLIFWLSKGIHNYYTFFSLCALWGYIFFQMADSAQTEYAMQSLIEDSGLFSRAIAEQRISVCRRRDAPPAQQPEGWGPSRGASGRARQVVKYQQRDRWSHGDLLRLAHPKAPSPEHEAVFRWILSGADGLGERTVKRKVNGEDRVATYAPAGKLPEIVDAFEKAKKASSKAEIVGLIHDHDLPREAIPTQWLNEAEVWDALLQRMPVTALVRNLGKMTAIGLVKPLSEAAGLVIRKLGDDALLKRARIHPLAVLIAQKVYAQGRGEKGSLARTASSRRFVRSRWVARTARCRWSGLAATRSRSRPS
jgi:hypothetical protein